MNITKLLLLVTLCLAVSTVSAQKLWEKPFQKWSKDDAAKVLNSSPWVQDYQSIDGAVAVDKKEIAKEQADLSIKGTAGYKGGSADSNPGSKARDVAIPAIQVRLQSALPVRQALVRLQEISAGYDKMNDAQRTEFDAKMKNTLDCPLCQKFYIVTMSKSVNNNNQSVEDGLFQTMSLEDLKGNVWLVNDKGERQELIQFLSAKNAKDPAIFFFPRRDSKGYEFLTSESKSFKILFNNEFFSGKNAYAKLLPRQFEFKVSSLRVGDGLAF